MPDSAPRFCPACGRAHPRGAECPVRRAERMARIDASRPSASRRGYDAAWRAARLEFLIENPWCAQCGERAVEVHHSIAHRGDKTLFWSRSLWVALCRSCHSAATAREVNARRVPRRLELA